MSDPADARFQTEAGERLAALPGVQAVTLGGSRAAGTAGPDSDWDFAIYYRGDGFQPDSLRELGWPGEIFPIGGWGGGVFNGGAWLTAGQRKVDVHYRDLADVEYREDPGRPAGLRAVDSVLAGLSAEPAALSHAVEQAEALLAER